MHCHTTSRTWLLAAGLAIGLVAARGVLAADADRTPSSGDIERLTELTRATLALVERAAPRPELAKQVAALDTEFAQARTFDDAHRKAFYAKGRALRREIVLAHPALDFDRMLINKRTSEIPGHMCDQYLGRHSRPGPGLAVLDSWKTDPKARLLLEGKLPKGTVHHPDLSFDARHVLFAFCDHSVTRDGQERAFFIYEAATDGSEVHQVTGTAKDTFAGALGRETVLIEDYDPCYLPGGGIAFISTRSQQYGRCHGDRYVPSYVLYRADADGSNIRQISFNEANEWDPGVLPDGRIVYTRWDYVNRHDTNFQSLWVTRPDGAAVEHYYGNYSVGPCMIAEAAAIPGSHKVVATATDHHGYTAGSILVIDTLAGQDGGEPLLGVTPEIGWPERGPPKGTANAPQPLPEYRKGGRCATPWPLSEELFLVAYPHGGKYAIYLIDTLGGRELIYADAETSCFAPMPLRPRPEPPRLPPTVTDGEKTGRFVVQDVYQSTQPIERGSIKRLRVSEIISQPTRAKPILSHVNNEIVKRILGTVPVAEDGSVAFEAPAGTPLQLQVLDANGMAVMTMRSLVYLGPGEKAGCVGCHEARHSTPPVVARPAHVAFRKLEPPAGPRYDGGFSFVRTVQPVLDRHCIRCHGLGKTEAGVNLLGTFDKPDGKGRMDFTASYESIMRRGGMVKIAQRNQETNFSVPKDYFAHAGKLTPMLLAGHLDKEGKPRVNLDRDSFQRIVDWLDLNAQFYGDYSFNRIERTRPSADGEKALREHITKRFGQELAGQPFPALVNTALPAESRILLAPLAEKAGGWGQVANGWAGTDDPDYQKTRQLVEACIRPPSRHDVAGTCGSDGKQGCSCGCCWVRQVRADRLKQPAAPEARQAAAQGN